MKKTTKVGSGSDPAIEATIVTYGDDGVTVLYFDGKEVMRGDYYHDKIDEHINGFIKGVKYQGGKVKQSSVRIDDLADYDPPNKWPNEFTNKAEKVS